MSENVSDLALDGNAAGGRLQQFFSREITSAQTECEACGRAAAVGSLRLYGGVMGAVLRCPSCDAIVMRGSPHCARLLAGDERRALPEVPIGVIEAAARIKPLVCLHENC